MKVKLTQAYPIKKLDCKISTSQQARKIAQKNRDKKLKAEMNKIQKAIQEPINDGLFHFHLDFLVMQENKYALEDAGFRVTNHTGHTCIGW